MIHFPYILAINYRRYINYIIRILFITENLPLFDTVIKVIICQTNYMNNEYNNR